MLLKYVKQVTEAAWVPVLWFCGLLDVNTVAKTMRKDTDTLSIVDHLTGLALTHSLVFA